MVSKTYVVGAHLGKLSELARLGVDLTLIVPGHYGCQPLEIDHAEEYKIRVLRCWLTPHNHFHFYPARIGPIEADLVHLEEEPWSLVTHQFMRRCVKSRKPTIFFTWQNIYKRYPPPFSYFERYTFSHANAAIAGNREAVENLRRKGFDKSVALIPIGVDPDVYCKRDAAELRRKLVGLDGAFVVGFIGRIVQEKGVADLIRAFSLLPDRAVLVVLGQGAFHSAAANLANELGVASRIRWIPQVPSLEIPQYMNVLDTLVLPSRTTPRWKEQFGRVLIEAMSCETAVVGSSSGDIPNVIGDAGLIFPEGDVQALATHLNTLYANPSSVECLGNRGRQHVLARYTHRRIAKDTLQFYEDVSAKSAEQRSAAGSAVLKPINGCASGSHGNRTRN